MANYQNSLNLFLGDKPVQVSALVSSVG